MGGGKEGFQLWGPPSGHAKQDFFAVWSKTSQPERLEFEN